MSCVTLKPIRDRPVSESDHIEWTNRELIPLVRQMRRFLHETLPDWCVLPTDGAEDGDIIVYDGDDGPGWQDGSTVTGLISPLTTKGDIWGYDTADQRIPVGMDDDLLFADSAAALGVAWRQGSSDDFLNDSSQTGTTITEVLDGLGAHTITAGAGMTGGGALNTNPTLDIVAADSTITVNADSIQANVSEINSQTDHGLLLGLGDDDHTQYLLLAGRGGQTISDSIIVDGGDGSASDPALIVQNEFVSRLELFEDGNTADEQRIQITESGGNFFVTAYADDYGSNSNLISGIRSGVGWTELNVFADLDMNGNDIDNAGSVLMDESASVPNSPGAGEGTWWVRNDAPNVPMFTDDGGTDHVLRYLDDVPTLEEVLVAGDDANGQQIVGVAHAELEASAPDIYWIETDQAANETTWGVRASGGDWRLAALTDAGALGQDVIVVNRGTGASASSIDFTADLDMNGNNIDMVLGEVQNASTVYLTSGLPFLDVYETDQAADSGRWRLQSNASLFQFMTRNDDGSLGAVVWDVTRSGSTPGEFNMRVPLDMNGRNIDMNGQGAIVDGAMQMLAKNSTNLDVGEDTDVGSLNHRALSNQFFYLGGTAEYAMSSTQMQFNGNTANMGTGDINNIGDSVQFDITSTPLIDQEQAPSMTNGVDMTMKAQQGGTGGAGTAGGDLHLHGGEGVGEGGGGGVFLYRGATLKGEFSTNIDFYDDLFMNGRDIDLENASLQGVDQIEWQGFTVAGAPVGSEGDIGFCTNGDAGNPCFAVHWNGSWRVWLTHAAGDALTAISAT